MKKIGIYISLILFALFAASCSAGGKTSMMENTGLPGGDRLAAMDSSTATSTDSSGSAVQKTEKIIETPEEYDASPMPLIAAIPEMNIRMYAMKVESTGAEVAAGEQVKLVVGEREKLLEWSGLNPRFILPQLQSCDYDGDGAEEISAVFNVGSGTGVSIDSLHIVSQPDQEGEGNVNEDLEDTIFEPEDYISQLNQVTSFQPVERNGDLIGQVTVNSAMYEVNLNEYQSPECGTFYNKIAWGSIARFSSENGKLHAEFGVGITSDKIVAPVYIGTVYTDIRYEKKAFVLENMRFEGNAE